MEALLSSLPNKYSVEARMEPGAWSWKEVSGQLAVSGQRVCNDDGAMDGFAFKIL